MMVRDLDKVCDVIESRNIKVGEKYAGVFGESILISKDIALGTIIEFVEESNI